MQKNKPHIAFRIATLTLVLAFLLPSAVKFSHVFNHHQHVVCNDDITTHLHASDVDCDFYKFKLNTQYHSPLEYIALPLEVSYFEINNTFYNFLNNHRQLSFSLRGPPELV